MSAIILAEDSYCYYKLERLVDFSHRLCQCTDFLSHL